MGTIGEPTIEYTLNSADPGCDLRRADETDLRYTCFLGDIVFTVGEADLSAQWGWVPILDFAAALRHVVSTLARGAAEARLDFTENEDEIVFQQHDGGVRITATYTADIAAVPLPILSSVVDAFARRVADDLEREYPDLALNPHARTLLAEIAA